MKKLLAILSGVFLTLIGFASSAFADVYTMSGTAKTAIAGVAKDTADSSVGVLGDLLPAMIPLIVVGIIFGIVMSFIHKRG